jgi:hypothetical protein
MRTTVFILIVTILLIGGCSSEDSSYKSDFNYGKVNKVAIVAIEGAIRSEAAKNQIADLFMMELLKKGYSPLDRAQVIANLRDQELQSTDLTTAEGAVEAGQILNVPAAFIVNIPHFGDHISITAKLMDVDNGIILWMGRGEGKGGKSLLSIFGIGSKGGEDEALLGNFEGGLLDGGTGQPLSTQEVATMQSIIKRICRTLPAVNAEMQK